MVSFAFSVTYIQNQWRYLLATIDASPAIGDRQKNSQSSRKNIATRRDASSLRRLPSANPLDIDSSISNSVSYAQLIIQLASYPFKTQLRGQSAQTHDSAAKNYKRATKE